MESWRKFQKVNENMDAIRKLSASEEFAPLGIEKQDQLVSIARQYAMGVADYKSLEKGSLERRFVDALIAINMETFGSNIGRDQSFASKPAPQDDLKAF
tara:strand:+ start:1277 stop:1573 length:297 start_codon:yes stop_codon:yes gene_type:complete